MSSEGIALPTHADEPPVVLLWSATEFVPGMALFGVGFLFNHPIIGLVAGYLLIRLMRRYTYRYPDGYLIHMAYWAGFLPMKGRTMPNPFQRSYLS